MMPGLKLSAAATWTDALQAELGQMRPEPSRLPRAILALGAVGMVVVTATLLADLREGAFDLRWAAGLAVVGAMTAVEHPSMRRDRLTLPISRPAHALARALARWSATLLLVGLLVGVPSLLAFVLAGLPAEHLGAVGEGVIRLLLGATVLFLLLYAVVLHTDRVLLWMSVPFFVFVLGMALREIPPLAPVGAAIEQVFASLALAVVGRSWMDEALGWTWYGAAGTWMLIGAVAVLGSAALLRER